MPFQSVHPQALPTPGCRQDASSGCVHLIFSQATRPKKFIGGLEIATNSGSQRIPNGCKLVVMGVPKPSAFAYFATASNQLLSNLRSGARSIFSYSRIFSCRRGKRPVLGLIQNDSNAPNGISFQGILLESTPSYKQDPLFSIVPYNLIVPKDGCNKGIQKGWNHRSVSSSSHKMTFM